MKKIEESLDYDKITGDERTKLLNRAENIWINKMKEKVFDALELDEYRKR